MENNRKFLYYLGNSLAVIGFILFFSVFLTGFLGGDNFDAIERSFANAPIGMLLIIIGSIISSIGKRGLAGSGVILDPEKAREDLKPFSKQAGGMVSDALEEIKFQNKEVIKVRCPKCKHLNDESAKFCNNCGEEL